VRQIRCVGRYPRWEFLGESIGQVLGGDNPHPFYWDHPHACRAWYVYDHEGD
jgi:hypothetical protein